MLEYLFKMSTVHFGKNINFQRIVDLTADLTTLKKLSNLKISIKLSKSHLFKRNLKTKISFFYFKWIIFDFYLKVLKRKF